jgi:oligopeptide/dipeptide ABC transporter ATP-binding protein
MHFPIYGGVLMRKMAVVHAIDDVSLKIHSGETLGLVGESGCGKTTLGRCLLRLYRPTMGQILFEGRNLAQFTRGKLQAVRRNIQMIFQDPFESLNARQTVGAIIEEPFIIHGLGDSDTRQAQVGKLLERVGLPRESLNRFPHEFSGGQRQRIGIARAIALNPKLVVCDEPVSALDVSIQSQIINLLLDLQRRMGLSFLFIAHDLAVVKHVSDRIAVMYLGKIVESAPAEELYEHPCHPYTRALMAAIPIPDPLRRSDAVPLIGEVPSPLKPPPGCRFHPRCPHVQARCRLEEPRLVDEKKAGHKVACHLVGSI